MSRECNKNDDKKRQQKYTAGQNVFRGHLAHGPIQLKSKWVVVNDFCSLPFPNIGRADRDNAANIADEPSRLEATRLKELGYQEDEVDLEALDVLDDSWLTRFR